MTEERKLPKIVLFGASLTEWSFEKETRGFGWVLQQKYHGKAEIVNEGVAGYTTTMLIPNFEHIIERSTAPYAPPTLIITILVGANDAAMLPSGPYVPLTRYEDNIRSWVEDILIQDNLPDTKIVLITPPPINIPSPTNPDLQDVEYYKMGPRYKTYMNKKLYAEKVMEIAAEYEQTDRVVGVDIWKRLVDAALKDQGRLGDDDAYNAEKLPGCGLKTAQAFKPGYFADGLHFKGLGYDVVSEALLEVMLNKWPELAPEAL